MPTFMDGILLTYEQVRRWMEQLLDALLHRPEDVFWALLMTLLK